MDDELLGRIFGIGESELDARRRKEADGVLSAWVDENEKLIDEGAEDITEWRKRGDRWVLPIWWLEGRGRPWSSSLWVEFNAGESTVKAQGHTWAVGKG